MGGWCSDVREWESRWARSTVTHLVWEPLSVPPVVDLRGGRDAKLDEESIDRAGHPQYAQQREWQGKHNIKLAGFIPIHVLLKGTRHDLDLDLSSLDPQPCPCAVSGWSVSEFQRRYTAEVVPVPVQFPPAPAPVALAPRRWCRRLPG